MRGISSLIDLDMEDSTHSLNENIILSSASEAGPIKKKAARTKAVDNGITKPKAAPRKAKSIKEDVAKKTAGRAAPAKRKATEERVNSESQPARKKNATNTAQSEDELDFAPGAQSRKKDAKPKPKRTVKANEPVELGDDLSHSPAVAGQSRPSDEIELPNNPSKSSSTDVQPPVTEQDSTTGVHGAGNSQRPVKKTVPPPSRVWQEKMHRRAGSTSDTERGGDPNLRRKLGDVTRKFENIDLKYRNLRDVGVLEANANVEKLRRQCDTTTSASNDLITALKQELRMHMPLAQEARQLQVELQKSQMETNKHTSTVTELETSLAAAQNEIKALQAKLTAARTSTATVETGGAKTPGSAIKNHGQVRPVMVGSAEAAHSAQTAQLKEELYSDLTGLIVRSVKRTEAGDAYDCIQTGRNGTLHFKLTVEPETDGRTTSFEEVEFLYTPLLDSSRDRDMIELLPYYLKEDITFSRHHAAKFYSRVVDALTKKMEED